LIDLLTLALTHGLMAFAAISLIARDELDEEGEAKPKRWKRPSQSSPAAGED